MYCIQLKLYYSFNDYPFYRIYHGIFSKCHHHWRNNIWFVPFWNYANLHAVYNWLWIHVLMLLDAFSLQITGNTWSKSRFLSLLAWVLASTVFLFWFSLEGTTIYQPIKHDIYSTEAEAWRCLLFERSPIHLRIAKLSGGLFSSSIMILILTIFMTEGRIQNFHIEGA